METQKRNNGLSFAKRLSVLGAFCMLLLPVVVLADSCAYEEQLNFTLPVSAVSALDVTAGAGSLYISSSPNAQEISVSARVCASRKSSLDGMGIEHVVKGDTQHLWTLIPMSRGSFWTSSYSYIDLELIVPEGFAMTVEDGSGTLEIQGTGDLVLTDGSGDARVFNIAGNVHVVDASGALTIEDVQGNVVVDDGSGSARIAGIGGNLRIDDGSGTLTIEDVRGDVDVDDGSGSLGITRIGGAVTIVDGSGDIDVDEVEQGVNIVESGSGNVRVDGQRGFPSVSAATAH